MRRSSQDHSFELNSAKRVMDCRVKPGNDRLRNQANDNDGRNAMNEQPRRPLGPQPWDVVRNKLDQTLPFANMRDTPYYRDCVWEQFSEAEYQRRYPVAIFELPVPVPGFDISLVWHPRNSTGALHSWVRDVISRRLKDLEG